MGAGWDGAPAGARAESGAEPHRPLTQWYAAPAERVGFVRDLFNGTAADYDRINGVFSLGTGGWYRRQALRRAGLAPHDVDWINLHGTGTRANDAAEDLAVASVFGDGVPCSSTKGWTGHTLGACGILEAVIAGQCMAAGFVAGCLGIDTPDPAFRAQVAVGTLDRPVQSVVSNSFGFGGANCSLVLGLLS